METLYDLDQQAPPSKNRPYNDYYVEYQLLALFKTYQFQKGVVYLCKELKHHHELLQFYIELKDDEEIINLAKTIWEKEKDIGLWIQALKYFVDSADQGENHKRIKQILDYITEVDELSPLLVLNLLSSKSIPFWVLKDYFGAKLGRNQEKIKQDKKETQDNVKEISKQRQEYKTLKTKATNIDGFKNCDECKTKLYVSGGAIHFICQHSFHQGCCIKKKKDKFRKCTICDDYYEGIIDRKNQLKYEDQTQDNIQEQLKDDSDKDDPDKFQVIGKYFGYQLFKFEHIEYNIENGVEDIKQ